MCIHVCTTLLHAAPRVRPRVRHAAAGAPTPRLVRYSQRNQTGNSVATPSKSSYLLNSFGLLGGGGPIFWKAWNFWVVKFLPFGSLTVRAAFTRAAFARAAGRGQARVLQRDGRRHGVSGAPPRPRAPRRQQVGVQRCARNHVSVQRMRCACNHVAVCTRWSGVWSGPFGSDSLHTTMVVVAYPLRCMAIRGAMGPRQIGSAIR